MELIYPFDTAPVIPKPTADSYGKIVDGLEWFPIVEPNGMVIGRSTGSIAILGQSLCTL